MLNVLHQDLVGAALPSVPNDELDSTQSTKATTAGDTMAVKGAGVAFLPKLVFFVVIAGIIVMFLKTRKGPTEKSLA